MLISYALGIETLTFLFTDIEGSTALLVLFGADLYSKVLDDHHRLIRASLLAHHGIEQGTQGSAEGRSVLGGGGVTTGKLTFGLSQLVRRPPQEEGLREDPSGGYTSAATSTPCCP